ncbi:HAMP domain-containing histidine kinase [Rossellomorea marisflavi]|uniref:HAMP domain-containing sensor histidine kinase n=1 Tax=Rossellomorea marisflavi TaxID=189381 RepID=UPI0027A11CC3|nr:HAMP domain-containing sensor histidine kinase [Rossellomorea marisflavi]UTE71951.1 HAMP domain-containing histidine kinase [Rossellomorea marisflavi]
MMKTLYKQFIAATLLILVVSTVLGFFLANFFYMNYTKKKTDQQQEDRAKEIVKVLDAMHHSGETFDRYLDSVSKLGYQIYVTNGQGDERFYGLPFKNEEFPEEAERVLTEGDVYHGISNFSTLNFMFGHFSNELQNTVGVPFEYDSDTYGLFIRSDTKLLASDFHTVLAGFIAVIAILNIIGMMMLAKQLTRPISKLTEATRQVSQENFSYPIDIHRKDEIGELSESFHRMQDQLLHNDRARKSFISSVSHDFQSPLMNIQGYADLLKTAEGEEERIEYAEVIERETKRLSNLTKQLLLLTSLDQEAYPLKVTDYRLDEQLKAVIRKYRWRMDEEGIELSYKIPVVTIRADEELLENVWENLLTNAIKYNREDGTIGITLEQDGGTRVIISDTGIGIHEDEVSQVFDKFYRVDDSRTKEGTGLGLSIVRQIISLHGGEVAIESELGKGTRFIITLPSKEN